MALTDGAVRQRLDHVGYDKRELVEIASAL